MSRKNFPSKGGSFSRKRENIIPIDGDVGLENGGIDAGREQSDSRIKVRRSPAASGGYKRRDKTQKRRP